uniref:Conjugal transfer protein n=1 Tax=Steinernema glaseri TaxID=37863 RepID=A0A1I8A200_9BILA
MKEYKARDDWQHNKDQRSATMPANRTIQGDIAKGLSRI